VKVLIQHDIAFERTVPNVVYIKNPVAGRSEGHTVLGPELVPLHNDPFRVMRLGNGSRECHISPMRFTIQRDNKGGLASQALEEPPLRGARNEH